jgi:3-oxoacyl-[acyl-carrier protein] reductase
LPYRGGIGQATARLFASRGVHLALHYFTQHDGAMALVEELRATGVRVAAFQADIAEFDAVRVMHAKVVEELGHPDILYSNAAMTGSVLGIKAKIENASIEEFERCWRANTGGAFLVSGTLPSPTLTPGC